LLDALGGLRRIVGIGHVNPDADCIGAMLGFARSWRQAARGEASIALPPGTLSRRLAFMLELAGGPIAEPPDFAAADGFVVLDTARASRLNLAANELAGGPHDKPVLVIDHHVSSTRFGTVNWIVDDAASSCELVYALLRAMALPVDAATASLLYAGLLTDTGGFALPTTSATALRTAAELVAAGAQVGLLGRRLYREYTRADFRLIQLIYANTHLAAGGRIAYSTASAAEIEAAGCTAADIDDQVNIPRSVAGIRIAILLTEGIKGRTRVNFRGEDGTDVLTLAQQFGGGGHRQAAGAVLAMPLEAAVGAVLPAATAWLDSGEKGVQAT
jgi:phosphoesterase RecJ-like protein